MQLETVTTIVDAASSQDLIALADLKTDLGITDSADDAYLTRAISQASLAIAQYCRRTFATETVQDVIDFARSRHVLSHHPWIDAIHASRFPIQSVTSVTEGSLVLVADVDYRVDPGTGIFHRLTADGVSVGWRIFPVTIVYVAGFADVPFDLQNAVGNVVKSMHFNRTRDPLLRSENILSGLYSYTLFDPGTLPGGTADQVAATLDAYRVPAAL